MGAVQGAVASMLAAFDAAKHLTAPFDYWLLNQVLPERVANDVCALPFAPPRIGDTKGKRETHNSTRVFFSPEHQARYPVIATLAEAFQSGPTLAALQAHFPVSLGGSYLRIEYCQDVEGFWLEPHTDISAKLITMLVYLSSGPQAEDWGTDIYDEQMRLVGRAPGSFNTGLVFVPGSDTWHGYAKRPMAGVRKSLIINFVKSDWRSRHELTFPDRPCPA